MPIKTIDDAWDGIEAVDADLSQGHVSIQEASAAVNGINATWYDFAQNCENRLGINLKKEFIDAFNDNDNTGENVFDAFGGIKNGAATGMTSVTSFFNATDAFKGSWRNPKQARQKLEKGLGEISKGITNLGNTLSNIKRTGTAIGNMLSGVSGNQTLNKLGGVMGLMNTFISLNTSRILSSSFIWSISLSAITGRAIR